jgi:DNA-directed RNA polymerase subunit beta'
MIESIYDRINDYGSVKISLASPNDIRSWSFGEVRKPETINYRTYRPEKDGLFCERIFGPERDWECACGKYKGTKYKGIICDRCGVKVTHSRVRRKRMGHINLAAPVVHIWFFKAMPSRLANILNMKTSDIEKVAYFQDYLVTETGDTPLKLKELLSEEEYRRAVEKYGDTFKAEMGAEAMRTLLQNLDLSAEIVKMREELAKTKSQQKTRDISKRLKIVESLRQSGNKSEWMVMDVIPVIPPDLRPLVLLESGNFATSDLNDLYRRIINRNNRLKKLVDLNAPEVIIRNEKRMLQQAVDALFDNGRCRRPVLGSSNRPLKSLTDMIKGKQGRFRENLLGKRVDYSARSVIVIGPELKLHQCGLPKRIALELYQPFIIRQLKDRGLADTIKSAKKMLERKEEIVWDVLEEVIREHPVLLNRAPTLHRMGIQAFEPVLIEGHAIQIHPLVCRGFNADFDGDQMAVHLPLSVEAQAEAHVLMLATNNIFSPSNGSPIMSPSQDIVLGNFYITLMRPEEKGEGMVLASPEEAILAYAHKEIGIHAPIKVRLPKHKRALGEDDKFSEYGALIETTVGRCFFNNILDEKMPFYNRPQSSRNLSRVISDCFQYAGRGATIELLDNAKELGFKWATLAGLSICVTDLRIPSRKQEIIDKTQVKVDRIEDNFHKGALTEGERYNQLIDSWTHARVEVTNEMMIELKNDTREGKPYLNPVYLMTESGARGKVDQIQQLCGMRALMAKPSGEIIETPIKANFREGLNVLEYFSSTHGARKGLADTALKTADSGYLTRKLADVAQNVIVNQHDCGTLQGISKSAVYKGEQVSIPLREMIIGRTARDTIRNPITDEIIVSENEIITPEIASKVEDLGLDTIRVRSGMTCESPLGLCACCYGVDLSTGRLVEEGMAVGIIAAQSIGEPGTQLTMRTFHTGGIAERAVMEHDTKATVDGTVQYSEINAVDVPQEDGSMKRLALKRNGEVILLDEKDRELERYRIPYGAQIHVEEEKKVKMGTVLFDWDPHRVPILSEVAGIVKFQDIAEGETIRTELDPQGRIMRPVVIEHKGEKHPRVVIEDAEGRILDFHYLPAKARIEVNEGQEIPAGALLAQQPRAITGTQDITGGLPRVTEVFEARKPKEPAAMAEISGRVELRSDKRRGKMTIIVRSEAGMEVEHHVPHDKHLNVHSGDYVEAGESLTDGPLVPHDILRIRGEEALQNYLLLEIQNVYRAQNVKINDKHVEIIITQMLRKVKVENTGDTDLLPSDTLDKFQFRKANRDMADSVKITEPGDTDLEVGAIVSKAELEKLNEPILAIVGDPAAGGKCQPANASTVLLGITKASLQSESFVSAASFQETTRVLTEASLAGKEDRLLGLKENVILGHLIPAGTAFKPYLDIQVKHLAEPPKPVKLVTEEFELRKEEEARRDAKMKEALGLTDGS